MAKKSMIQNNLKRIKLTKQKEATRTTILAELKKKDLTMEERFRLVAKLSKMPRNSSKVRIRNRCETTGRPRGFYRKFKLSRIELRKLATFGLIPGITKGSW